uniref:Uncharacterized protein n=1 Tax=Dulem virus 42 TaxID=3145760 RepID=A0AAU8B8D2_9CAUD
MCRIKNQAVKEKMLGKKMSKNGIIVKLLLNREKLDTTKLKKYLLI